MLKLGGVATRMLQNFEQIRYVVGEADIIERMPNLSVEQPFTENRIAFLNTISKILLSEPAAKQYSDVVTFAFWIRRASLEQKKSTIQQKGIFRLGRGTVFHIAPSNVAVNYAYSFAAAFILGNANIVRLPSKDFPQTELINRAVNRALDHFTDLKKYIAFIRYSREKEINDYISSLCDVRVIWGGDETIRKIRMSCLPPRASEITFADRYSIAVLDASAYMKISNKERMALDFYNDTFLTDQNACSSPRLVCWYGSSHTIEKAKEIFWKKLRETVEKKYPFQAIQAVDKLSEFYLASANLNGLHLVDMQDNRIMRIKLDKLEPGIQKFRGNSGFFYEYDLRDIMELIPLCGSRLQTVAYCGELGMFMPLLKAGVRGIDRLVPIGQTMDFNYIWDGYDLTEWLTRVIGG